MDWIEKYIGAEEVGTVSVACSFTNLVLKKTIESKSEELGTHC